MVWDVTSFNKVHLILEHHLDVPVYLKKAQPYVQLAQEKSLEAGAKLKTLSQTALVKLEEYVPGAQKQLNKFGD